MTYFCSSYSNTGTESSSKEPSQEEVTQVPSTPLPDSWLWRSVSRIFVNFLYFIL